MLDIREAQDPMLKGNNLTDRTAKEIAMAPRITPVLIDLGARNLPQIPNYMPEDLAWIHTLPIAEPLGDWWENSQWGCHPAKEAQT